MKNPTLWLRSCGKQARGRYVLMINNRYSMKTKKVIAGIILSLFLMGLLSSCAIDRKCPAYSKVTTEASNLPS